MILVSGEALMDVFDAGRTATGVALDARIGGSPLNVAIGLARLGQPVSFFGGIGRGFLGERLLDALRAEGVDTSAVVRVAAPTTLGLVGLDSAGVADYAFYGAGGAERQPQQDHLQGLPQAMACHFGSYSMVVEPVGATLRELARRSARRGALVTYDLNVRLNVEPDVRRWAAVLQELLPHLGLLKLSDEDHRALFGHQPEHGMVRAWLHAGVAAVLMTRGSAGLTLWTHDVRLDLPAAGGPVVDTVGAGDTVQAALLAWLAEHEALSPERLRALTTAEWTAALEFAARAAAITCSRRGADPPRRDEL